MALKIQRTIPFKSRIVSTVVMIFALLVQPLAAAQIAGAAVSYTNIAFTAAEVSSNWSQDRALPTGGYSSIAFGSRSNVLAMNFNKDAANMSGSGFYQTEGLKRATGTSTALKADLYVDADWITSGKTVRAGLWGTGKNASNATSAYPIIEFTTDGHTGWRTYNTLTGAWNTSAVAYNSNGWNTLEIKLDTSADTITYHINNAQIGSASANGSTVLAEAILNSKNYGPSAQSYSARWSQFGMGVFTPDPPATPTLVSPANNAFVKGALVTNSWNAVPGATGYIYQSYNDATATSVRWTQNVSGTSKSASNVADSVFWWRVKAVNAAGIESEWSQLRKVTVDSTAPATTLVVDKNSAGRVGNEFTVRGQATDSQALNRVYVQLVHRATSTRYGGTTIHLDGTSKEWNRVFNATELNLPEGTYAAHVSVTDNAGNSANVGWSADFTLDKTIPSAPVLTVDGLSSGDSTNQVNVTARWNKPSEDTVGYLYQYWNSIPGNPYKEASPWSNPVSSESYAGAFTEGQGTHYMRVSAIDSAGNQSGWSNVFVVTYDTSAPTLSVAQPLADSTFLTTEDISVETFVDDNFDVNRVVMFVNGRYFGSYDSRQVARDFATVNGGLSSFTIPAGVLPIGEHRLVVNAFDEAGNNTTARVTFFVAAPLTEAPLETEVITPTVSTPTQLGIVAQLPIAPIISGTDVVAQSQSSTSTDESSEILGEQDSDIDNGTPLEDTGEVLGLMDQKFLGIAWYWYIVILVAIIGAWLILAAAIRRGRAQE